MILEHGDDQFVLALEVGQENAPRMKPAAAAIAQVAPPKALSASNTRAAASNSLSRVSSLACLVLTLDIGVGYRQNAPRSHNNVSS